MTDFFTILVAIAAISAVTVFGSIHARATGKPNALIALFVIFAALSQIMATKIAEFDFGFMTVTAPAAVIIFAVTFLITDIVNEKFGRMAVHGMIAVTFATQVVMVAFLWIGSQLPGAVFWDGAAAWDQLFGIVPRITIASWITFVVSENLDAWIFAAVRRVTGGRHLWARNAISSIPALTIDTLVFVPLAFAGSGIPILPIMIGQFAAKYIVAILDIPFMYLNRALLGRRLVDNE